ncbi:MAG: PH domain-containing protein [Nitrospirae bacterium]|nr:PH domain-containing protein [Nitrospirota bacterium]
MSWSFSFQLLPGEKIIEDSSKRPQPVVKASYSLILTDTRAVFRFDGLGSSLSQSLYYHEISDVKPVKRLFIPYLNVRTEKKELVLNISDPEYWAARIIEMKQTPLKAGAETRDSSAISSDRKKRQLLDMLIILHKNSLISSEELEEKIRRLDSLK